jgi:hypothetical protein
MAQLLRPISDIANPGNWVPEPSDTTLWDVMDEASPNDADYAWLNAVSGGEQFSVNISAPGETPGSGGIGDITVRWRAARIDGAQVIQLRLVLLEGIFSRGIDQETLSNEPFSAYEFTNTAEISDFTDLKIAFDLFDVSGGGKASDPAISWVEIEVPDAAAPSAYIPKIIGPF